MARFLFHAYYYHDSCVGSFFACTFTSFSSYVHACSFFVSCFALIVLQSVLFTARYIIIVVSLFSNECLRFYFVVNGVLSGRRCRHRARVLVFSVTYIAGGIVGREF